jgi:hypothetical protein
MSKSRYQHAVNAAHAALAYDLVNGGATSEAVA